MYDNEVVQLVFYMYIRVGVVVYFNVTFDI